MTSATSRSTVLNYRKENSHKCNICVKEIIIHVTEKFFECVQLISFESQHRNYTFQYPILSKSEQHKMYVKKTVQTNFLYF